MESLRITLVLKTNEGGRWVIPHLQEMIRRGHSVTVIIPEGLGKLRTLLKELGVVVEDSAFDFQYRPSLRTLLGLFRLRRQLLRTKADILHYHLYASALAVRVAAFGLKIPKVHMVAGPLYLDSPAIRWVERRLMFLDTLLVAGSSHTADRYRALGLNEERLLALPYGVDTEMFRQPIGVERSVARGELGIEGEAFVVVMIAYVYGPKSLVHSGMGIKGHDVLLEAWENFARSHPKSRLLLVGSGFDETGNAHRRELMSRYADPALNIKWIENVNDVRPYYWAANVSVSPSLSENHGAALEAGACGIARIVSDAGGLPETTDIWSGWVVRRGDSRQLGRALDEAHADFISNSLEAKGGASRLQIVSSFDSKKSAAALVDAMEALVPHTVSNDEARELLPDNSRTVGYTRHTLAPPVKPYFKLKRLLDIISSGLLLVATLPLQLVLYLAVLTFLGRPVFFRQCRPGLNGESFELRKFRTMKNENAAEGLFSDADRLTPFGRWLRRTSMDELPTLVNVLRGEMSMVGPRPLLTRYMERYTPEQGRRHDVKPGITGLAQVSGRNALSWEEKLRLDVVYVRGVSLRMDFLILMRTVSALLRVNEVNEPGQVTKSEFMGSHDEG